jgi:hypothetical protein
MLEHFREMHAEVLKALDALPPEALDWSPGPEMNSLTVLVMHITGSERYWVGDVVKGTPSFRDREAEFQARGVDVAALKQRLADLDAYEAGALETLGALTSPSKVSPATGGVTVARAAARPEHTSVHVGHIEVPSAVQKARP